MGLALFPFKVYTLTTAVVILFFIIALIFPKILGFWDLLFRNENIPRFKILCEGYIVCIFAFIIGAIIAAFYVRNKKTIISLVIWALVAFFIFSFLMYPLTETSK